MKELIVSECFSTLAQIFTGVDILIHYRIECDWFK